MTEEQLRDILARVVPEPPDSVADPAPVVRAARRQRRVATTVVSGVAVLAVVGTVFGVQALRDDPGPDVVNEPAQIPDPYTTAPCPDAAQPWPDGDVVDLDLVTAVRVCPRPSGGYPAVLAPADALVADLETFADSVRQLPEADPGRCAATDPIPSESRLLLQLDDGSSVTVPLGSCDDVQAEGRAVVGSDLDGLLFDRLRAQRDDHEYVASDVSAPAGCDILSRSPALPAGEHLVAATACTGSEDQQGVELDAAAVERLDSAWRDAEEGMCGDDVSEDPLGGSAFRVFARTDRGDIVRLADEGCRALTFNASYGPTERYLLDIASDDLVS